VKYAVVSDIHANLEALNAVFERLAPDDGLLCLGDIVGYGPNPNECVAAIRERASACILGNHDVAAVDNYGVAYFNPAARDAIAYTQRVLTPENAAWLDTLAYEVRMPEYLLVHGAPVDYFSYILDKPAAARAFAASDAPLILVGHTHIPAYYQLTAGGTIEHRHVQHGGTLPLEPGARYIVNVGSVGQPRDLNPQASFAFYDPAAATVSWERVEYPIAAVQEKMEAAHLPAALVRRLSAGR
jgi:diadenosine tetraphosphatase ApaH/serine/threonine PP2A family protein phosphatase